MRTASEIVMYLTRHFRQEAGEIKEDLLPAKVNDLIAGMGEFLASRLEEDTPHKAVWEDFTNAPAENAASLTGVLEALFEAQPAVRDRVDAYMRSVTTLEAQQDEIERTKPEPESSLQAGAGDLISDQSEGSTLKADRDQQKNPPVYLYGNERRGIESDRQEPPIKPFMIGKNAQVVYIPTEKMQFPMMFEHLGRLAETSQDLALQENRTIQENLTEIRAQLTEEKPFDDAQMANAFEEIWEAAPSYANTLIESLQDHLDDLPIETRDFIVQMHTPLH